MRADDSTSLAEPVCLGDGLVNLCSSPVVQSLLKDVRTIQSAAKKTDNGSKTWWHASKCVFLEIAVRKLGLMPGSVTDIVKEAASIPESWVII